MKNFYVLPSRTGSLKISERDFLGFDDFDGDTFYGGYRLDETWEFMFVFHRNKRCG